jgi:hypothetical protein
MLNNQDLAELLESTRQRISQMGGEAPSSQGVVRVLDGLIGMLRDEAPTESEIEPAPTESEQPAPRRRVPARFRTQPSEQTGPPNPLLQPQYADFFAKLVASHKSEPREAPDQPSPEPAPTPPRQSSIKPQYQGFFDALVQKQKEAASTPTQPQAEESEPSPPPDEPPPRNSSGFHDETATR